MTSHANHQTHTLRLTGVLHAFTHLYKVALLLYTVLALTVVASLSALPFLHALRKREEEIAPIIPTPQATIQPARDS